MTLTGPESIEAMMHVMLGEQEPYRRPNVAVWHAGNRYGGFTSYDHIAFWLKCRGLTFDNVRIENAGAA